MLARTPSTFFAALMLVVIGIGIVRACVAQPSSSSIAFVEGEHRLTGTLVDINVGDTTVGLTLDDVVVDGAERDDRALVRVPRYPASQIGDRVTVMCDLERPQPIEGFAYDTYLAARDVYAVCTSHDPPLLVAADVDRTLRIALTRLRQSLTARIAVLLPEPQSTLLAGLLFGVADFRDAWRDRFLVTGTSHVVAASGFNVAMVMLVCFHALTALRMRRQRAFPLLLMAIALYVMLAGLSPAVVRAGVMGALVLTARHVGRKTTMRNIVLVTGAVILTVNPLMLWDVGFQLSFVSTIALIWFAPLLAKRFAWIPETLGIRESFVGSLAATLCTLPIVIASFGQVSLVSPLVNMLVLPLVPYAMAAGALMLVAAPTFSPIGDFLGAGVWTFLTVMLDVIAAVATLPFASVALPHAVRAVVAVAALLLTSLIWFRVSRSHSSS